MTTESDHPGASHDWQTVWTIFHDVLERPVNERDQFLDAACGDNEALKLRVRKLLLAHRSVDDDFLSAIPPVLVADSQEEQYSNPMPGDQIGPYLLADILGVGGMGVVYRALQEKPVKREVALKLLQAEMSTREVMARFEAERQALAIMNHSSIAKIYDAGTTENGRPYFVMEYVAGMPVTDYCDDRQLSIDDRARLFLRICDGVQHAHQKGIIHRDLKPSNILVSTEDEQAVPKIIDFGIAKATEQRLSEHTLYTHLGTLIGTPGYMSPEQAGVVPLDVDTRADVYSLGVLLYELIVGVPPFASMNSRRGLLAIQEAIRDEEPQRPSVRLSSISAEEIGRLSSCRSTRLSILRKRLDGDISWVALKAMEKDRTQRYSSVAELLADVQRYLNGVPVQARAHTRRYRAMKFARRHRVGVALSASIAMLVLAFAGLMTQQTIRLHRALDEEVLQRNRAEQVSEFMVQLFEGANPEVASGEAMTASGMLDRGASKIREGLSDQPELRAKLLATISETYRVLGGNDNAEQALSLLELALADIQSLPMPPGEDLGRLYNAIGAVHHDAGNYNDAERSYLQAIEHFRHEPDRNTADLADALGNLSMLNLDRGNLAGAEDLARESLELQRETHGVRSAEVARMTQRLGYILHRQGNSAMALPMMLDALDLLKENYGDDHALIATALNYTAIVQRATGDARGAQTSLQEAAAIYRRTHGDQHPYLANTLSNLAIAYNQSNDFQHAIDALDEAMRIGIANFGADHPSVNSYRINMGTNLQDMGRFAEAESFLREGLKHDREDLAAGSPYLLTSIDRLGAVLDSLGKWREAETLLQEAVDLRREYLGNDHTDTGVAYSNLASNLLAQGELDRAEAAGQRAFEIHRLFGRNTARLAAAITLLGRIQQAKGNVARASALYDESLITYGEPTDETALQVAKVRLRIAELAEASDDTVTAEQEYTNLAPIFRGQLDPAHADIAWLDVALGRVRCINGKSAEGIETIQTARPRLERALGANNGLLATANAALDTCFAMQAATSNSGQISDAY